MAKIPCNKTRPIEKPYEIWQSYSGDWEWHVLKKWQKDDDKQYARWFCGIKSPFTYGEFSLGDVYVSDIKSYARLIKTDYDDVSE